MYADIEAKDDFIRTNYKVTPRHTIEEEHLRYFPAACQVVARSDRAQAAAPRRVPPDDGVAGIREQSGSRDMSEAATIEGTTARKIVGDPAWALSQVKDPQDKTYAVIGAGASGICLAKHLLEVGLDITVFEIGTNIGGMWVYENDSGRSSAYKTLHINTAKHLTNYSDFKFKDSIQRFPSHWDMHEYLHDYAEHFGVKDRIQFRSEVASVTPLFEPGKEEPRWQIETIDGRKHEFDTVCVATGHLTKPLHVPEFQEWIRGRIHALPLLPHARILQG